MLWLHTYHRWLLWDKIGCHRFCYQPCYCSYRSDFYRSDWSPKQLTLLMNYILGLLALLLKLAIVLTDLTFINWISPQGNLLYSWITRLVLAFIWAIMQLWLLEHLATSLNLSTISGLHTIKKYYYSIEDQ